MSKSAYQRAGYLDLLSIAFGVFAPFIPLNGAVHTTAPLFVIVGVSYSCFCSWNRCFFALVNIHRALLKPSE